MVKKIGIILLFVVAVGARHAVSLQGLAFAAIQENGQPCPPECVTDSMEIITYYPSPYGYYEELRGDKIIVGDSDNSYINETDLPPTGTITFEPKSSAPSGNLYESTLYYDGSEHKFKYYYNGDWQDLGGGGGAYWDILTGNDIHNTNSGNIKTSGNMGIGMGTGDTIGASLHILSGNTGKGLIVQQKDTIASTNCGESRCIYSYTGSAQTYTVPKGISQITINAFGAKGGGSLGGLGGGARATFNVSPGEVLYLYVGGNSHFNGGGWGGNGNGDGGDASDVRKGGSSLNDRIIVAGGGGGSGSCSGCGQTPCISGGAGGGGNGQDADGGRGGMGGTDSAGGTGGAASCNGASNTGAAFDDGCCPARPGGSGNFGIGGSGGGGGGYRQSCSSDGGVGGGGGGGYFGGGGGGGGAGGHSSCGQTGGGGGGGSNWIKNTGLNTALSTGVNSGTGQITIDAVGGTAVTSLIEWQSGDGTTFGIIDRYGKFGIGTASPGAYLDIAAGKTTIADAWSTRSSLRFKENLYPIDNALTKLTSLQGVYFDYKDSHKHSLGLVAEDVGRIFPELVTYEPDGKNAIALDYDKLGAVTVEAVKEQQQEIEKQGKENAKLREEIQELKETLTKTNRNQQKEIDLLKAKEKH